MTGTEHQLSTLSLRDALLARRPSARDDASISPDSAALAVEKIAAALHAALERPPQLAFSLAKGTPQPAPVNLAAAWQIDAAGNHAFVAFDAVAVAIVVAQMFAMPANAVIDPVTTRPRPLEAALCAALAAIVTAAFSDAVDAGERWQLGPAIDMAGEEWSACRSLPRRLAVTVTGYGATGTVVVHAESLPARPVVNGDGSARIWRDDLARAVARVEIPARVALPLPRTSLGDVARWRPGDVIALPARAAPAVAILAGAETLANGELGRIGHRYCMRVDDIRQTIPNPSASEGHE